MRFAVPVVVVLIALTSGCLDTRAGGPVVVVHATYPKASAQMVADCVAAPIEQQINGVERMMRLESESQSDGTYVAYVRFQPRTHANEAVVLVQNRVALAMPMLPDAVREAGVKASIQPTGQGERLVRIAIVDRGEHDRAVLQQFAAAALQRIAAAGAIANVAAFPGPDKKEVRVDVDREACARHGVSIADLSKAVDEAAGEAGVKDMEALKAKRVRSITGGLVSIGEVATIKVTNGPSAVYRVDLYPAVRITGTLAEGQAAKSAASKCAALAEEERQKQAQADRWMVIPLEGPDRQHSSR